MVLDPWSYAGTMASARTRRLRWFAPLLVAAVIALLAAIPNLAAAATPTLAPLTAQQLLVKVQDSNVSAFSGTIDVTPDLGIPDISELAGAVGQGQGGGQSQAFSPTDLLSGSSQALVWFAGPQQNRVALLRSMAETDVIHNGRNIWTWDSTSKKVVHYTLAVTTKAGANEKADNTTRTPQQMADQLLAHLDPSTALRVGTPVVVAHQDAYQLILTPRAAASTIDHIAIAIDSANGFPLQVQVFAKGQKTAAVKLGFGQISFSQPAASRFTFTPPPGSSVTNKTVSNKTDKENHAKTTTDKSTGQQRQTTVGDGWSTVAIVNNVQIPPALDQYLQAGTSVTGPFGAGRLFQTSLVNILVLNDGRVAIGAVNASTLEAAAAASQ